MRIFWVWHSDSTITVDEMAHREQIQGKVHFMKMCRIGLVGIPKTVAAARGGWRSKKQPNWGEGLCRVCARWQRVGRTDNLAVRGWTGQSQYEEQEQLEELWLPFGGGTNSPTYLSIS